MKKLLIIALICFAFVLPAHAVWTTNVFVYTNITQTYDPMLLSSNWYWFTNNYIPTTSTDTSNWGVAYAWVVAN